MLNIFRWFRRKAVTFFFSGFILAILLIFTGKKAVEAMSTDAFCVFHAIMYILRP